MKEQLLECYQRIAPGAVGCPISISNDTLAVSCRADYSYALTRSVIGYRDPASGREKTISVEPWLGIGYSGIRA